MNNFIELKTRDDKPRTCTIQGKHKKIYIDPNNPKMQYIRYNKKYILKDKYKEDSKSKRKKRQQGGADNNDFRIVVILSIDDASKFDEKYYVAETEKFKFEQPLLNKLNVIKKESDTDIKNVDKVKKLTDLLLSNLPAPIKYEFTDEDIYIFSKTISKVDFESIAILDASGNKTIVETVIYPYVNGNNNYKERKDLKFMKVDSKHKGLNVFKEFLEKPFMKMMYLFGGNSTKLSARNDYTFNLPDRSVETKNLIDFLNSDAKKLNP